MTDVLKCGSWILFYRMEAAFFPQPLLSVGTVEDGRSNEVEEDGKRVEEEEEEEEDSIRAEEEDEALSSLHDVDADVLLTTSVPLPFFSLPDFASGFPASVC